MNKGSSLTISRILHAGYVFECGGTQIAFDPIFETPFSRNCYAFPEVAFVREEIRQLRWDAVFISHFHDDHCSLESLNLLDRSTPIYIFCLFEELFELVRELGFKHVFSLTLDEAVVVGPLTVWPRRALDADVDSLFHIRAAGLNILNVVDSWIDHEMMQRLAAEAPWDLVLWPFQTMRELEVLTPSYAEPASRQLPPEWLEQLSRLQPRAIVPSSCQFVHEPWSWYKQAFFPISYQHFQQEIEALLPHTTILRLDPSQSVTLGSGTLQPGPSLSFVRCLSPTKVDYQYCEGLVPPPTSEIAQHFEPLNQEQKERVWRFCSKEILEIYRRLEPPDDRYFSQTRYWRLAVFDERGQEQSFYYRLRSNGLEVLEGPEEPLGWTTELPLTKLYGALEQGESLTSLYVRLNEGLDGKACRSELKDVDVLEDPLIRCLFQGSVLAYQRSQLARIQAAQSNQKEQPDPIKEGLLR